MYSLQVKYEHQPNQYQHNDNQTHVGGGYLQPIDKEYEDEAR